jgi:hypothetical protein
MSRNAKIFSSAAVELIRELADQGKSASEIADVIGSTAASVRVKCSHFKIKLSRRGRPGLIRTRPDLIGERKLVVYMRPEDYAALKLKATHMGKSAVELAGLLLQAIVSSDIYEAVLDEGNSGA